MDVYKSEPAESMSPCLRSHGKITDGPKTELAMGGEPNESVESDEAENRKAAVKTVRFALPETSSSEKAAITTLRNARSGTRSTRFSHRRRPRARVTAGHLEASSPQRSQAMSHQDSLERMDELENAFVEVAGNKDGESGAICKTTRSTTIEHTELKHLAAQSIATNLATFPMTDELKTDIESTVRTANGWDDELAAGIIQHLEKLLRNDIEGLEPHKSCVALDEACTKAIDVADAVFDQEDADRMGYGTVTWIVTLGVLSQTLPEVVFRLGLHDRGFVPGTWAHEWKVKIADQIAAGKVLRYLRMFGSMEGQGGKTALWERDCTEKYTSVASVCLKTQRRPTRLSFQDVIPQQQEAKML